MNREIEYIMSVSTYAVLTVDGAWSLAGGFPTTPDEIVIRQVSYNSADVAPQMYLIGSNINHQMLGTVISASNFNSNPGSRIHLRNPIPQTLNFQLYTPTVPALPTVVTPGDMISIHMDFIKYR